MTNKYHLLKTTGNLTGRTIFLTCENYLMTNHRPQTKIFTSKKSYRFSRLSLSAFTGKNSQVIALSWATSRFADIVSVEKFIEGQENENTRKKTEQNIALLKEFLTLKGESRAVEEIPPDELNSFISEFIITINEKERRQRRL